MTYLIIRTKTFANNDNMHSVHDHTEDKDMALDKVRGYTLANSEKDVSYTLSEVHEPLTLTEDMVVKQDKHFNYNQEGQLAFDF